MSRNPKLIDKWLTSLPRDARRAISGIIAAADASDTPRYLVGGPVRDLLLDQPSLDIDLVVEGDAIELARRAAHYLDATVKTHPSFGTATVILRHEGSGAEAPTARTSTTPRPAHPEALVEPALSARQPKGRAGHGSLDHPRTITIDIATARTETYPRPGALPRVQAPTTIEQDLLRRDFTINTIALPLNGPNRGEIIDPTNGRADLESRLIRILHDRSFQDDPTRIIRAVRYAARLGFRIERSTLTRLKRDTRHLQRVSGARLHHEFTRIFDEPAPETTLRHLDHLGVLAAIHPALHFERAEAATFHRLRVLTSSVAAAPRGLPAATIRSAYWPALALSISVPNATTLATRLALTNPQRAAVEAMPRLRPFVLLSPAHGRGTPAAGGLGEGLPRSALANLLAPFPLPAIWALAAATTKRTLRTRLLDYLTTTRHVRPVLRGDDLIALGIPEGPAVGEMLARLRAAKLNGEVKTKTDEIRLVQTINNVGDLNGGSVVGQ